MAWAGRRAPTWIEWNSALRPAALATNTTSRAVAHHQVGRVAGGVAQRVDDGAAVLGQLHRGQVFEAQAQHGHAQLVIGAVADALDKTELLQRLQHAEHRGARQVEAARELGAGEFTFVAVEQHQQLQAALRAGTV